MKLFHFYSIPIVITLSFAQVNTESMRGEPESTGITSFIQFDFDYISGNSEIFFLNGTFRFDYRRETGFHSFLTGTFDRSFEKSEEDFSNRGFTHFRITQPVKESVFGELYLQKEYNHYLDLQNRELIGCGLRWQPIKNFYLGNGLMQEMERYSFLSRDNSFLKSTNYLTHSTEVNRSISFNNTFYYQFKLKSIDHFRILWDGELECYLASGVSYFMGIHLRYDKSDINPDGNTYMEVHNGIGIQF